MASKLLRSLSQRDPQWQRLTPFRHPLKAGMIASLSLLTLTATMLMPLGQSNAVMAKDDNTQAKTQAILNNEKLFTNYVKAAFAIEKQRRSMMGQVKQLTGGSVPGNVCINLNKLPGAQKGLVKGICNTFAQFASSTVTKKYKLSPNQFNTFQRQTNRPAMRKRINQKIQALKLK